MIRANLKMAWRHLLHDKLYSVINVVGLSVSLVVCYFVFQYVQFELGYEKQFKQHQQIFRVTTETWDNQQLINRSAMCALPVGPGLKGHFPEVKQSTQLLATNNWFICTLKYNLGPSSKTFNEQSLYYADKSFFEVFSWPLMEGEVATALEKPFTVVISTSTAERYFGREPAVGKVLHLKGSLEENDYQVTGVMPDLPEDTHLKINVLFSQSSLQHNRFADNFEIYTYLLLHTGANSDELGNKISAQSSTLFPKMSVDRKWVVQPIDDIHLDQQWQDEMKPSGSATSLYLLMTVTAFIILIALVNYIKLATARALRRAKEVGVRKVSGAARSQVMHQLLTESYFLYASSFIFTSLLVFTLSPVVSNFLGTKLAFGLPNMEITSWAIIVAIAVLFSIAAYYPAHLISSFKPTQVLKGKFTGSGHGLMLRRALVIFQFVCAVALITGVYIMHAQQDFMEQQSLGFEKSGMLIVKAPAVMVDETCYDNIPRFKHKMEELSFVKKVTTSSSIPGQKIGWTADLRLAPNEPVKVRNASVQLADPDFIQSYKLRLLAGKNFTEADFPKTRRFGSEAEKILLNDEAVRQLGFINPEEVVGKTIHWGDVNCLVVGVVSDYHQQSLKNPIQPTLFTANLGPNMSIRLSPESKKENLAYILPLMQKEWNQFFPESPFDYFFLDDFFDEQYAADLRITQLFDVFCGLAILVSCLGLFGLSMFTTRQRSKEMGVRKVLGASTLQVMRLFLYEFLRPIILASLVACPLVYYLIGEWLTGFAFHLEINLWQFLIPIGLVSAVALLTVIVQTTKAANANPVDALKQD